MTQLNLQAFLAEVARDWGITDEFREASDHPGSCRCDKCREWWKTIGPDEDGTYGPFSAEEIERP